MRNTTRAALAVLLGGAVCALPAGAVRAGDAPDDLGTRIAHYENVERELRAADTSHLTEAQRAERERLIRELRAYRETADFGINAAFPGERRPYFVDDDGRRCAVAHLLHVSGEDALVERVARDDNHAYVSDLAQSPELASWLSRVGLSLTEAARIQAPTIMPPRYVEPPGENIDNGSGGGTGDGKSAGPATGPTTGGGGIGGSSTGRPSGGSGGGGAVGAESWWMWWEFNKLSFLQGRDPAKAAADASATTDAGTALATRRAAFAAALAPRLADPDARVRGAAAIALGRIGGDDAVASLVPLLDDAQQSVRESAILALGATGSSKAGPVLLAIADRATHEKRGGALSPNARGLAVLALGIARRAGLNVDVEGELARIVDRSKKLDAEQLGTGGMMYLRLAPGDGMARLAAKIAADRNAPDAARARAVEELSANAGEAPLRELQRALAGRDLELRRSAALSLGTTEHELVLPRLMTAFELENEPLTRGFILIAIGERGGDDARAFLAKQLADQRDAMGPWAALALGVTARDHDDDAARALLRGADLPSAQRGALSLARGLARDTASVQALSASLTSEKNPLSRAHAAAALGMVGGDDARFALLSAHANEKSTYVRAGIAVSLGVIGAGEDADFLLSSLADAEDPALQGTLAVACGLHGSPDTVAGLEKLTANEATSASARATAIQALGILLDHRGPMVLPEVSSQTNYAVMPAWVLAALQTAL